MDEDKKNLPQPDHDILIELRTEMRGMRTDMKTSSDDTKERLLLLGANKMEKEGFHQWEIAHITETGLREKAIWEAINGNAEEVKKLKISDARLSKQLTWAAGALAALSLIFTILGPLLTSFLAKVLKLN